MDAYLKILWMTFLNLSLATFNLQLGLPLEKKEIVIESEDSFTAWPVFTEELNENIWKHHFGSLFHVFVESNLIIYGLLASSEGKGDIVVFWRLKASLSYPFDPETDQLFINFGAVSDFLNEL